LSSIGLFSICEPAEITTFSAVIVEVSAGTGTLLLVQQLLDPAQRAPQGLRIGGGGTAPAPPRSPLPATSPRVYVCQLVRYISTMAIEAVLQEVLKMPADERAELVERLIDSLNDDEIELSADELAQLDEAIADADRAVERGDLIPADDVLAQMRQIS
jgi:hypothetical protein